MALAVTEPISTRRGADVLIGGAGGRGSEGHPYLHSRTLLGGPEATRNLADAVHYLCELHGPFPGVIDIAAQRSEGALHRWLHAAAKRFTAERTWLTSLVVAAGPLPSTPGQAESEAARNAQCHALEMLAHSDRFGCALGAALALLLDWHQIHAVLTVAAGRFGVDPAPLTIPDAAEIHATANEAAAGSPALARAIAFGSQQLLLQHHGLWSLLEAREAARRER
jgi:hypothetical protein